MDGTVVEDSKVCRICASVASSNQEQCANCGNVNWGPIPRQLAWTVQPKAVNGAEKPSKLVGYRGFDTPEVPSHALVGDLPKIPTKDPEFAAMLASLTGLLGLWGFGHMYVGKRRMGILLLLSGAAAWATYILLNHIGKGPLFWVVGAVVWALLIAWAYGEAKEEGISGKSFKVPAAAVTLAVFSIWWQLEIVYIFIALGLTTWIYLTTRAYNLAVEYNYYRDRYGASPW